MIHRGFLQGRRTRDLIAALDEIDAQHTGQGKKLDRLYKMLDILDSKTSSLLRFNGIIIASVAVLSTSGYGSMHPIYFFILMNALVTCGLCFFVVRVEWPFLGKVREMHEEINALAETVDARTEFYQWSWLFSVISISLLFISLIVTSAPGGS